MTPWYVSPVTPSASISKTIFLHCLYLSTTLCLTNLGKEFVWLMRNSMSVGRQNYNTLRK